MVQSRVQAYERSKVRHMKIISLVIKSTEVVDIGKACCIPTVRNDPQVQPSST